MNARSLSPTILTSVAALVVAAAVLLTSLPALLGALLGRGAGEEDPRATLAELIEEHDAAFEKYTDRFSGRSIFFDPPPKPAPRVERPVEVAVEDVKLEDLPPEDPVDTKPPVPATYTGPSPLFIIGEEVWFNAIRADEKAFAVRKGEEKEGIRVIETQAPWSVKIGHKGGEYDLNIFERGIDAFFTQPGQLDGEIPGIVKVGGPPASETPAAPPAEPAEGGGEEGQTVTQDEKSGDTAPADDDKEAGRLAEAGKSPAPEPVSKDGVPARPRPAPASSAAGNRSGK